MSASLRSRLLSRRQHRARVAREVEEELSTHIDMLAREYERAIPPLERAASLSEDGELWLRLAQVHVQREEWAEAVEAVDEALSKGLDRGGPNTPCHGHLLVGIARYNQERLDAARASIARARSCEKTVEMAERWLQFLEREIERQRQLSD